MKKHIIITMLLALIPLALCAQVQQNHTNKNQVTASYRAIVDLSSSFDNTATVNARCERSATQSGSVNDDASWSHGFEVTYQRYLGSWKHVNYGALAGVGYNQASFAKTFTSSRGDVANALDIDVVTGRVGPYVDYAVTSRLTLSGSVGLMVANVNSDYSAAGASTSHTELLYGPYAGGGASFRVYKNWSAAGSVYYAPIGATHQSVAGQSSSTDFGHAILVSLGVGFTF